MSTISHSENLNYKTKLISCKLFYIQDFEILDIIV